MLDADLEYPDPLRDLSDEELDRRVRGVHAERTWLDAEECRLVAEAERRRAVFPSVFRDTGAWYQARTGVARSTARMRVEVAVALAAAAMVQDALCLGEIGFDHARIVAEHLRGENREQLLGDQVSVLHLARGRSAEEFRRAMAAWAAELDEQRDRLGLGRARASGEAAPAAEVAVPGRDERPASGARRRGRGGLRPGCR